MLEAYRKHVEERAAEGVVPKPLDAEQVAGLVELLKNPPQGEEEFILDLLENRIPPGVDEAAYVKAGFLTAVAKGEVKSPLVSREKAAELLGTMQGGYNISSHHFLSELALFRHLAGSPFAQTNATNEVSLQAQFVFAVVFRQGA